MSTTASTAPTASTASTRLAAWAFAAVVVVGAVTIRWIGRDLWFDIDDWGFLAGRSGRDVDDLLDSWNQHWTTVPILAYRSLWQLIGINHFWPYQALTIAAHLASACLLRVVMRRAGANPWVATAAAALFVFLGSGNENLVKAFQFTFAGSLAFGLAHLVLADGDGPIGRRDLLGLGCGLVGLMCSGISVAMVAIVGLAVLLRRGWRAAAVHTVPLAVVYAAWWAGYRGDAADQIPSPSAGDVVAFTVDLFAETLRGLGQLPGVGAALALGGAVGLGLALRREGRACLRGRLAAPVALALGSLPLAASIAWGRAGIFGGPPPIAPRYVHLTAALLLPAIAVGLSELGRDRRPVLGLAIALLVVGIPGNIAEIRPEVPPFFDLVSEEVVLSVAERAEASPADPSLHPLSAGASHITVGWLQEGRRTGRIPDPPAGTAPSFGARADLALAVLPIDEVGDRSCTEVPAGAVEVQPGDRLRVRAPSVRVFRDAPAGPPASVLFFAPGDELVLIVEDGPLTLRFEPPVPVQRCR
jgi:hypothetical protein